MTLIEAFQGGELIGRCDERCYDVKDDVCHCICQGENHGVGVERALENTRTRAGEWKTAERKRHGRNQIHFTAPPVDQPTLWEGESCQR